MHVFVYNMCIKKIYEGESYEIKKLIKTDTFSIDNNCST